MHQLGHSPRSFRPIELALQNGFRVLQVEDSRLPTITLSLSLTAGARNDTEELAGLAAMVSRLLDEGTVSRTSLEIAEAVESVGGSIECDCSHERTTVSMSILAKDMDLGLDILSDVVEHPAFLESSLAKERERTLAEIHSAMDRPQVVAGWAFDELVYKGHPLHRPVHGYVETIRRITPRDLRDFHERYFVPSNAILSIVGDFSAEAIGPKLEALFGEWGGQPVQGLDTEPLVRHTGIRKQHVTIASQQAHVYFGHLGIRRKHPDFYALQVMDAILGGGAGLTSRLPRRLRDELGLAYTTFASITSFASMEPGKFLAYIGTAPGNVEQCISGFLSEVDRIRSEPVEAEELNDAKSYLTGSFVFGFETNSQIARFLTNANTFDLGYDYIERYPTFINAVTREDVQRAAEQHLSTEDYSLVTAGPIEPAAESRTGVS